MLLHLLLKDAPHQPVQQYLSCFATDNFVIKKGASFNVHNLSGEMSGTLVMGSRQISIFSSKKDRPLFKKISHDLTINLNVTK